MVFLKFCTKWDFSIGKTLTAKIDNFQNNLPVFGNNILPDNRKSHFQIEAYKVPYEKKTFFTAELNEQVLNFWRSTTSNENQQTIRTYLQNFRNAMTIMLFFEIDVFLPPFENIIDMSLKLPVSIQDSFWFSLSKFLKLFPQFQGQVIGQRLFFAV